MVEGAKRRGCGGGLLGPVWHEMEMVFFLLYGAFAANEIF